MKRFLSIMLTMMLVLSSFVMVSAEELNLDKVITVDGEASRTLGQTFNGYYEITAKVYVPLGVETATIAAMNGEEEVVAADINTEVTKAWQDVKVFVAGTEFDGVKFTATGGKIYVSSVSVDKVYAKNLIYEDSFEHYNAGENVYATNYYRANSNGTPSGDPKATTNPVSEFNVKSAEALGRAGQVANLNYPDYLNDGTIRTDDSGSVVTAEKVGNFEYYGINLAELKDKDHVIIEVDVYNAANAWASGTTDFTDKTKIKDALTITVGRDITLHTNASELPKVVLKAGNFILSGKNSGVDGIGSGNEKILSVNHNAEPKNWNKLVFEAKRESYVNASGATKWHVATKATYGGQTLTNDVYQAYGDDFGRVQFAIEHDGNNRTYFGGRFYLDNLKVYSVEEDLSNVYVTRLAEDFDGADDVKGQTPNGFSLPSGATDTTSFTIESGYGKNTTQFGRLLTTTSNDGSEYSVAFEDGTSIAATQGTRTNEYFNIPVPGLEDKGTEQVGDKKNYRVSFKYYLPEAVKKGSTLYDQIQVGMIVPRLSHLNSGKIVKGLFYSTQTNIDNVVVQKPNRGTKNWIPVVLDVESTFVKDQLDGYNNDDRYDHDITYYSTDFTYNTTITGGYDINNFCVGLRPDKMAGMAYIDDIKVETAFTGADDLDKLDSFKENVYLKKASTQTPTDEFRIAASGTFSNDSQSISLAKIPGDSTEIQIVLALYKEDVLEDASVNVVNTSEFDMFAYNKVDLAEKVTVPPDLEGYTYKVFILGADEGLKPLADMVSGAVKAPAAQ